MNKKWLTFRNIYLIYLAVLTVAVAGIVISVHHLLRQYEQALPQVHAEKVMEELIADACGGNFWEKYSMPQITAGKYEEHLDIKAQYLSLYTSGNVECSQKKGIQGEDELIYVVESDDIVLAEVKLKAVGPAVTKLAILNYREWQVESVQPVLEPQEYTLSVPADFHVTVNGVVLTKEDGTTGSENEITYTISGVYGKPEFTIRDKEGNPVTHGVQDHQVIAEFYYYTLTLPKGLSVMLNGQKCEGEAQGDDRIKYDIRELVRPTLQITDGYGNVVEFDGGNELPLTYMTITADSRYTVKVAGAEVPEEAVSSYDNPDYEYLTQYVEELPGINEYHIAILVQDAEITVTDVNGNPITLAEGEILQDLTSYVDSTSTVPEEVSAEIDVLKVAQNWSLFMSRDYPFDDIKQHLIANSYQYKVAHRYATGIDITFISSHTLKDPVFSGETVTNFVWIADNCFSVDICFTKHMLLANGLSVDDVMNDRFYFVKYDDTKDKIDNPTWKIACMKENVSNEK